MRIVHLGLGAFHRAHQAWYTAHAADAAGWGIAAFTGRTAELAERLREQDGLYTLIVRGPETDDFEVIDSIVQVGAGSDVEEFARLLAAPDTAVATLTITEAGYLLDADGEPDTDDEHAAEDIRLLEDMCTTAGRPAGVSTALGRILVGLELRRRADAGPIALVSCDNLPGNGEVLRRSLLSMAQRASADLERWIADTVSFVSTSVDRITPRRSAGDAVDVLDATGMVDAVPVVTEPFSDWVLSGVFPAGRPDWESAGARFVDDIEPFEARKLWLLNGAHTLLSFAGPLFGHATVAEAFADPVCRAAVETLWDDDERNLPAGLGLAAYRQALAARFANPRIEHRLEQIAIDGLRKLQLRVVPVARLDRAAGRDAAGCAAAIGAWLAATSPGADETDAAARLVVVDPELARDERFVARVAREQERWTSAAHSSTSTHPQKAI